jgi:hypothetical protein
MRLKQHQQHMYLGQPEKSVVAEHSFNTEHGNQLKDINILSTHGSNNRGDPDDLHPNRKKDDGLILSMTSKPFLHHLKEQRKPSHMGTQAQNYSPFHNQQIQALLLNHVLQLSLPPHSLQFFITQLFLQLNFFICSFLPLL